MGLDYLLQRVKDAIFNDDDNMYRSGSDRGSLIGNIERIFGEHTADSPRQGTLDNPLPASQDPLGDPADQERGRFGNIRPASEDPLGDPADQETGRR
jgi:hypothetical protein